MLDDIKIEKIPIWGGGACENDKNPNFGGKTFFMGFTSTSS